MSFSFNFNSNSSSSNVIQSLGLTITYPMLVLKTRRQVFTAQHSYLNMCRAIIRYEGFTGFYKGFGICFLGCISGKMITATAYEITKRKVSNNTNSVEHDLSKKTIVVANTAVAVVSIIASPLVRIPFDVVCQRLMVQGNAGIKSIFAHINNSENYYKNGSDVFRKIMRCDGPQGLYRGFGTSILIKLISFSIWMPSANYVVKKLNQSRREEEGNITNGVHICLSGVVASGLIAMVTTPLDTIRTRLQVLDAVEENGRRRPLTFMRTARNLVNEGGMLACYRGFGPRWAAIFISYALMSYSFSNVRGCSEHKLN